MAAAGRPGLITINNAPTCAATIAMFDEERGLRRSDYMESTGMSECKVAYDDLNRMIKSVKDYTPTLQQPERFRAKAPRVQP